MDGGPGLLTPLRAPMFRRLALGRVATYFGNALAPVALAFAVLDLTGSVVALGVVVGARSVANVALLLLAGVLADRLPRSVILQGASAAAALSQALTAAAVLAGFASVPLLVVLSVVNGAVSAASLPAASALTPQTVPKEQVLQANALVRMAGNTAMVVGASLGGVLSGTAAPGWALAGTAVVFAAAAVGYARVKAPEVAAEAPTRPLADLKEGWRAFSGRTWLWSVVVAMMVVNAAEVGGVNVLGPSVADNTIGRTAWGVVLGAQTLGALVGGFLASRWQPRRLLLTGTALVAVVGVQLAVIAHLPELVPLLVVNFGVGLAVEQFVIAWDVSLQENVPPDQLARVYSYDAVGSFAAIPLGEVAVGPLATVFGTAATLTGLAVLAVVAVGAVVGTPSVRGLVRATG